ncbi:hypothetical protein ABIQ69_05315 [Agromyces sp. G08B096]|uniref:Uncharacterized protein n=1 Tax=Agromyces sp. G08B096 TaxID=3156399 RepID=A0AAU7WA36_9MICO
MTRGPDASPGSSPDEEATTGAERREPRQRIERVPGRSRRARLTPAPGSDPSPESGDAGVEEPPARPAGSPDDERITRERPPHW